MFGIGAQSKEKLIAVIDIGSADAALAVVALGDSMRIIAGERTSLPIEKRSQSALASGVLQQLSAAGEKALAAVAASPYKGRSVDAVYVIVGAPWARSFSARSASNFEAETAVTDGMIAGLAQQALAEQKEIDRARLLEASVVRVMLNGYPTGKPAGKHTRVIDVFALLSDCDQEMRQGVQEIASRWFPGAEISWRSSARAAISLAQQIASADTYLIVDVGDEAVDLLVVRKGILSEREIVEDGVRVIAELFAPGAPPEETLALLQMLEGDQCETDACEKLKEAVGKAEPELVRRFGEAFGKLALSRRLPNHLFLIAPRHISGWFETFLSRIDFTQFTSTAQPFSIDALPAAPEPDPLALEDSGLRIACALVNTESRDS